MRLALLIILVATSSVAAAEPKPLPQGPLSEARHRHLKGNYAEARAAYEKLTGDPKHGPSAIVGISRAWREEGDTAKALNRVTEALKATPNQPDLLAERADLYYDLGRWDDAIKDAEVAISAVSEHFLARWTKARILRDRGDLVAADEAMRWFVRIYTARSNADKDVTDPDTLLIIGQAAAEFARWHNNTKQFTFILNEVYGDALKYEPDLWRGEYLAGMLLLEKYNRPDAVDAFDKALMINASAAEPLVGKGLGALQKYELKEAERFANEALKLNPKLPIALRLKAHVQMMTGELTAAEETLATATAINPRDAVTLGMKAALMLVMKNQSAFEAIVKDAESFDTKPGVFYHELADSLEGFKYLDKAEVYFVKAAELRPTLAGPRTGLGLLYLRLGKEAEGRVILDKAFEADRFNVRVANMRKVLDHLDTYAVIQTPHYDVKYNPNTDKLLAEFIAEYLEVVHADLKKQFDYEPQGGRIPYEIFSRHDMFSGRTTGLPDLHTIGATTGRAVAMASPSAQGVLKPFNWARVVRHELVHIFNLAQTGYQCPHWLTEGLAVRNEKMASPLQWMKLLRDARDGDYLFTLDNVMMGFVRPKNQGEWTLAYCQSHLYVEYISATYGPECIAKLLKAYAAGADTAAALKLACRDDKAAIEKGYRAHIEKMIKPYWATKSKPEEAPLSFDELETAHDDNPDDLDIAARLAEQYFRRGKPAEARKLADQVLEKKKGHPTAAVVRARLLHSAGDDDGAKVVLETAMKETPNDPRLMITIGRYYVETEDFAKAADVLERGRKIAPLDGDWLEQLVKVYVETKEPKKLASVLKDIVEHDPDDMNNRLLLAKLMLESEQPGLAAGYAREAIQIDLMSSAAQTLLIEALTANGNKDEAETLKKRFEK